MKNIQSFHKDRIRVLMLENIHQSAMNVFQQNAYTNVEIRTVAPGDSDLAEAIQSVHLLGIRSRTKISRNILNRAEKLIAVGCFCIGTDQVDLETAARMGIPVFNAPHSNTRSVAEMVIGLSIMLMRSIFPRSLAAHEGRWIKTSSGSNELRGKTMGIVGYGHIGSQVSVLAESMGMRVLYFDIRTRLPMGNAASMESLESLLAVSDIVTLHVPEDPSTINMMNRERLSLMKKDACLINASRGKVVDVTALADILKKGMLRGAAVDVFPTEPSSAEEMLDSPLMGVDRVILTPHIGGATIEAQENIGVEVATKLVYFSDFGSTEGAVNFPNVNLKHNKEANRFLHIHENRPGLLKAINAIVASHNINVMGQYLETRKDIGYVVLDIAPLKTEARAKALRRELEKVEGTIRTRVLY